MSWFNLLQCKIGKNALTGRLFHAVQKLPVPSMHFFRSEELPYSNFLTPRKITRKCHGFMKFLPVFLGDYEIKYFTKLTT